MTRPAATVANILHDRVTTGDASRRCAKFLSEVDRICNKYGLSLLSGPGGLVVREFNDYDQKTLAKAPDATIEEPIPYG
jgi:hypothetical protein